jgi:hypothetical protein
MSVRAVAEIARDLKERLPEWMGVVADRYGVPLPITPTVFEWWQVATDEAPKAKQWPAVHVRHAGARLGTRKAHEGVHDSTHSVVIEYDHLSEDRNTVAASMTYAAEAFLRWMDTYPLGSREGARLIQKIAAPDGQNIRLQVDEVMARIIPQPGVSDVVQYRWGMTLTFDIDVRDTTWSPES